MNPTPNKDDLRKTILDEVRRDHISFVQIILMTGVLVTGGARELSYGIIPTHPVPRA